MNIMNRLTWKSMVKNRTRTIITAIGIALAAALFCAVTTMGASILSYMIDLQIAVGGDYHVSAVTLTQEEANAIRNREYGQTLIVITHDESIALQADRLLAIEDGHIVRDEVIR